MLPQPFFPAVSSVSAVRGDDLPGDRGHVPRHHQRDDVSHGESCPAYGGKPELHAWLYLASRVSM